MSKIAFRIAGISLGAAVAFAVAAPADAQLLTHKDLSVAAATAIAMTAIETCKTQGYNVSAHVLGREGQIVVAIRNPAAGFATFENSMKKAYTARTTRAPSGWSTGPAGRRFQSRQISRCTGIHLGMSRRPGMNGMSSSSTVARPVM